MGVAVAEHLTLLAMQKTPQCCVLCSIHHWHCCSRSATKNFCIFQEAQKHPQVTSNPKGKKQVIASFLEVLSFLDVDNIKVPSRKMKRTINLQQWHTAHWQHLCQVLGHCPMSPNIKQAVECWIAWPFVVWHGVKRKKENKNNQHYHQMQCWDIVQCC